MTRWPRAWRCAGCSQTGASALAPALAAAKALDFFCDDVQQRDLLQVAPEVRRRRAVGAADAHLAADLLNADAQFRLLERVGHLFLGELALPHGMNSRPLPGPLHAGPFCYRTVRKPGTGSILYTTAHHMLTTSAQQLRRR